MKNCDVARRTWNRLRLAMLWGRSKVVMKLRLVRKYLKCLCYTTAPTQTHYSESERELSFDNTPFSHLKTLRFHLPDHIPCINPQVDFDDVEYDHGRQSPLMGAGHDHDDEYYYYDCQEDEEEIDKRAEEFIAKFYQQLKLQRLQYNETPNRDSS